VAAHRPLPQNVSFPKLEEEVLERWRERDVFKESMRRREGAEPFVFYEGPPTANGRPGSHHVLARVFKDIFPRYQTMRGRHVERKAGWDCHGLPVEIAVEQQLGFTSKSDIERYGIAEFNQKCRESVFEFLDDWTRLTERIAYWVDPASGVTGAIYTQSLPFVEPRVFALYPAFESALYASLGDEPMQRRFTREGAPAEQTA
jgi:isoleucyl-tRNA synthetase